MSVKFSVAYTLTDNKKTFSWFLLRESNKTQDVRYFDSVSEAKNTLDKIVELGVRVMYARITRHAKQAERETTIACEYYGAAGAGAWSEEMDSSSGSEYVIRDGGV